jgi:hypothetical protein
MDLNYYYASVSAEERKRRLPHKELGREQIFLRSTEGHSLVNSLVTRHQMSRQQWLWIIR